MSPRRALVVLAGSLVTLLGHLVLVRLMAHGHVAHVLLGSGNGAPPISAALLAVTLVLLRFAAVVLVPGAILAALASLLAELQSPGTGITSGTGTSSGVAGSGAGTGASIEGRGTK